jgi:hypothetical protein
VWRLLRVLRDPLETTLHPGCRRWCAESLSHKFLAPARCGSKGAARALELPSDGLARGGEAVPPTSGAPVQAAPYRIRPCPSMGESPTFCRNRTPGAKKAPPPPDSGVRGDENARGNPDAGQGAGARCPARPDRERRTGGRPHCGWPPVEAKQGHGGGRQDPGMLHDDSGAEA